MATERVRIWRPSVQDRVLLMAGQTTQYAIEPRGEYVVGVVSHQPMRSQRGRQTRLINPGQLVAWDPSAPHAGSALDGRPWTARLMVIEIGELQALLDDPETRLLSDVAFPEPVISDPHLTERFRQLHVALERPTTRLERDTRLSEWVRDLVSRHSADRHPRPRLAARDDQALRRAIDHLADCSARNVGLDELAAVAGLGKFRLVRLFREWVGLPPHALQIAHRIRTARRLLEAGESIAATAAATGFADQSHLHRHFTACLGWTPRQYQRRLRMG